jgi:hypothetical protein
LALGALPAAGVSKLHLRLGHPHNLLSNSVCFLLVFIPRLVDCQFRLQRTCLGRTYGNPGEIVFKAR